MGLFEFFQKNVEYMVDIWYFGGKKKEWFFDIFYFVGILEIVIVFFKM